MAGADQKGRTGLDQSGRTGSLTCSSVERPHQGGIKFLTSCQPNFQTIISPETAGRTIQMNKQ